MVVTARPSACAASTVQDFTDSPSSSTVHAPHDVESQPMLVPVRPTTSRRYCTSSVLASTSCSVATPLTVIATGISGVGVGMRATLPAGLYATRVSSTATSSEWLGPPWYTPLSGATSLYSRPRATKTCRSAAPDPPGGSGRGQAPAP